MIDWNARDRYPFLAALEAHAATFRDEALAIPASLFVPMPDEANNYTPGGWRICPLFLAQWSEDFASSVLQTNRAQSPRSAHILAQFDKVRRSRDQCEAHAGAASCGLDERPARPQRARRLRFAHDG